MSRWVITDLHACVLIHAFPLCFTPFLSQIQPLDVAGLSESITDLLSSACPHFVPLLHDVFLTLRFSTLDLFFSLYISYVYHSSVHVFLPFFILLTGNCFCSSMLWRVYVRGSLPLVLPLRFSAFLSPPASSPTASPQDELTDYIHSWVGCIVTYPMSLQSGRRRDQGRRRRRSTDPLSSIRHCKSFAFSQHPIAYNTLVFSA